MATGIARTVSTLNVRICELPIVLAAVGRMYGDISSQITIPITETTIQAMIARRKWRGSVGVGEAADASFDIGVRHVAPLIICYSNRSSHVPGGGHRPAKPIGRFFIVSTWNIAMPDIRVTRGACAELKLDYIGRRIRVAVNGPFCRSIVRYPRSGTLTKIGFVSSGVD